MGTKNEFFEAFKGKQWHEIVAKNDELVFQFGRGLGDLEEYKLFRSEILNFKKKIVIFTKNLDKFALAAK